MSQSDFFNTLRSSDHEFITALRFLDDYAKHAHDRGQQHQLYRNFIPRFDLEQHNDTYQLHGELPGFRREDVVIEAYDDHNLQVSGSAPHLVLQPAKSGDKQGPEDKKRPEELQNGRSASKGAAPAQESYPLARFGDELDPHAEFVKEPKHKESTAENADMGPKVRVLISERHPCSFHRAFHFPTPIKRDEVTATMQDGILHITAPRAPMQRPVKVAVRDEPSSYPGVLI